MPRQRSCREWEGQLQRSSSSGQQWLCNPLASSAPRTEHRLHRLCSGWMHSPLHLCLYSLARLLLVELGLMTPKKVVKRSKALLSFLVVCLKTTFQNGPRVVAQCLAVGMKFHPGTPYKVYVNNSTENLQG